MQSLFRTTVRSREVQLCRNAVPSGPECTNQSLLCRASWVSQTSHVFNPLGPQPVCMTSHPIHPSGHLWLRVLADAEYLDTAAVALLVITALFLVVARVRDDVALGVPGYGEGWTLARRLAHLLACTRQAVSSVIGMVGIRTDVRSSLILGSNTHGNDHIWMTHLFRRQRCR